ncbi:proprotein convertase subtilisin/kexin type 5-like [Sminthopsis crassicaudata]|uniref:proprotein convertase subtilisin/kexin type 5-like n=1 Tax=Sminthopsis crassicaudata TaxID=9301 RepID=UPI003D693D75
MCPTNMMLYIEDGRCIHCCSSSNSTDVQDYCDCQETTEECSFRAGVIKSKTENTKRTGLLITSSIMLILLFGVTICVWRRSKAKSQKTHKAGYEKLSEQNKTFSSYKSSYRESTNFQEDQVIEYRDRDYDENEDDDIVYMGQDGTVYRKFKYGLLDDDDEDELDGI